jgi:dihydroorotate dehydrogenase (NAD+) catalytic subunit
MTKTVQILLGLRFRNPILLASGILGISPDLFRRMETAGAGGIVTKSVGVAPKKGHANPTIVELPYGLINAMGLPNAGWKDFSEELEGIRLTIPLIISIFGSRTHEFSILASNLEPYADAFELNLSCPHAAGFGAEVGSNPNSVRKITEATKASTKKPVIVKLTPNTDKIFSLAKAAEVGGADAISAVNTLKAMAIDTDLGVPILANRFGGLSGPCIRPVGVRCIYEIYEAVKIPLIGIGGIENGYDVVEYMMAGANLVQVGTVVWRGGTEVLGRIAGEFEDFLSKKKVSLRGLVGMAHRKKASFKKPFKPRNRKGP